MENKGLLFIPDISGFTRFISETEIEHSRMIIQELLEILINANNIGLEISEIEGDAILFYKFGKAPAPEDLYKQVEKMFCDFNQHIMTYDNRRYCWCKACVSAIDLRLKIITHYGEFTSYNVKSFNKLIGKDVIVAHQLLKNEIEQHEYWLVTKNLLDDPPFGLTEWMRWYSSIKQTETGHIPFHYTQLGELRSTLAPEQPAVPDFSNKSLMISVSKEFDTDIITLFHAVGDFNYRHKWLEGIKRVEEINHLLPRVGMRCRYITDEGDIYISSSSYSHSDGRVEFSETNEQDKSITRFILEETSANRTMLRLNFYINKGLLKEPIFNFFKKKHLEDKFNKSISNITAVIKEIGVPSAEQQAEVDGIIKKQD